MPTIAIIEDNLPLANTLKEILAHIQDAKWVGTWHTGEEGLLHIPQIKPDIVLMDINLPGIDGIQTTERLKRVYPAVQIIMVTVYLDHGKIFDALKSGACGYILKRTAATDIPRALKDLALGGAPMSPEIARRVVETFHQPKIRENVLPESNLTKRETEILASLSTGKANKEIASELNISPETVRVHLKRIYEKLHVHTRTEAAILYRDASKK